MKSTVRLILSIVAVCLVAPAALSAKESAKESAKDIVRPKKVKPSTQEQVVKPVLLQINPLLPRDYETARREPTARPVYTGPIERTYESPVARAVELGTGRALRDLQGWTDNPGNADGRRDAAVDVTVRRRADTPIFEGRPQPLTRDYIDHVRSNFPSFGGGILLEGIASGLGRIDDVQYDGILNAFIFNEGQLYFSPIPPQTLAAMCRAIALDQRVGASIGEKQLVYGKIPHDSLVAIDLKKADKFLANIALARSWIPPEYPLAGGFVPRQPTEDGSVIVQFNLNGYRFIQRQDIVRLASANFDVRVIPTAEQRAPDGGFLVDEAVLARGFSSPAYNDNVRHVTNNIDYYRRERVIDRTLRYGEVAALLRALRAENVSLTELASVIEEESGVGPLFIGPPVDQMQQPISRLFAAWNTLDIDDYLAQWSRSAVQYGKDSHSGQQKVAGFGDIVASRQRLFPQLRQALVYAYEPIYLGYRDGAAHFHNSYTLAYWELDGTQHGPWSGCEHYKVRNEGGRWVIVENREDERC